MVEVLETCLVNKCLVKVVKEAENRLLRLHQVLLNAVHVISIVVVCIGEWLAGVEYERVDRGVLFLSVVIAASPVKLSLFLCALIHNQRSVGVCRLGVAATFSVTTFFSFHEVHVVFIT